MEIVQGETVSELVTPAVDGLRTAASGTQAWGTDLDADYGPGSVTSLLSPLIDVSNEASPRLSFNYFIGSTLHLEGGQLRFRNEAGDQIAIIDENFSGQSVGWTPFSVRFPSTARGGLVMIEFIFLSDGDDSVGAG